MTSATELTLADLIRQVIADNPDQRDSRQLAKAVEAATPDWRLVELYTDALVPMIQTAVCTTPWNGN